LVVLTLGFHDFYGQKLFLLKTIATNLEQIDSIAHLASHTGYGALE